jgi:hypothetical protein
VLKTRIIAYRLAEISSFHLSNYSTLGRAGNHITNKYQHFYKKILKTHTNKTDPLWLKDLFAIGILREPLQPNHPEQKQHIIDMLKSTIKESYSTVALALLGSQYLLRSTTNSNIRDFIQGIDLTIQALKQGYPFSTKENIAYSTIQDTCSIAYKIHFKNPVYQQDSALGAYKEQLESLSKRFKAAITEFSTTNSHHDVLFDFWGTTGEINEKTKRNYVGNHVANQLLTEHHDAISATIQAMHRNFLPLSTRIENQNRNLSSAVFNKHIQTILSFLPYTDAKTIFSINKQFRAAVSSKDFFAHHLQLLHSNQLQLSERLKNQITQDILEIRAQAYLITKNYLANKSPGGLIHLIEFYNRIRDTYERNTTPLLQDLYAVHLEIFSEHPLDTKKTLAEPHYKDCIREFNSSIAHAGLARILLSQYRENNGDHTLSEKIKQLIKIHDTFEKAEQLGYLFNQEDQQITRLARLTWKTISHREYTPNSPRLAGSDLQTTDQDTLLLPSGIESRAEFIDRFKQTFFEKNQSKKEKQKLILKRNFQCE